MNIVKEIKVHRWRNWCQWAVYRQKDREAVNTGWGSWQTSAILCIISLVYSSGAFVNSSMTVAVHQGHFTSLEEQFSYDARVFIGIVEIPVSLQINWGQPGIQYVSVSQWTMLREGMKWTEITGM